MISKELHNDQRLNEKNHFRTFFIILNELRKHQKLAKRRHPMFEKNRFGKFFMYFMSLFWAGYLIFFGIAFAYAFREMVPSMEPYHILNTGLIYLFTIDFCARFAFQKTPTQDIKSYLLLPVTKNKLLDLLLFKSAIDSYNAFLLFMIIPFSVITIIPYYGITGLICYSFGFYLLAVLNNFWYLMNRTLINEKTIYVIIPIIIYAILGTSQFIFDIPINTFCMNLGEAFIKGNILSFIGVLFFIGVFWMINRYILRYNLYSELGKTNDTKVKHVSEYNFLEKYGEIGEYFRLELKLLFRNKRSKSMFRMGCFLIILLTGMLFTPSYEGPMGKSFVCIYNLAILGILMLTQLMSFEGNYLDGLMSRKESIVSLLKAKYYFYSFIVIVPMVLMIPAIIMGKISFLMVISYAFFTTGFIYFMLFQLAVYNSRTTPLNENLIGRQASTGFQSLISLGAFGIPILLSSILRSLMGEISSQWTLLIVGIILTFTSDLWIKNVYKRFMKRRYKNMEGFRDTK